MNMVVCLIDGHQASKYLSVHTCCPWAPDANIGDASWVMCMNVAFYVICLCLCIQTICFTLCGKELVIFIGIGMRQGT